VCGLLVLAALSLTAPLLAVDECDESCGTHCGDCALCPLAADLGVAVVPPILISTEFAVALRLGSRADFPRVLDHVPLSA
jgi:hypothetical protein